MAVFSRTTTATTALHLTAAEDDTLPKAALNQETNSNTTSATFYCEISNLSSKVIIQFL